MKALLSETPGPTDTLKLVETAKPEPGENEVRIRIAACAINYPDALVIEDKYQFRPERPFAPGAEFSGHVDAIGPGVEGIALGDRVIGAGQMGGLAEFALVDSDHCYPVPDEVNLDTAAALIFTYGTTQYALQNRGALKAGETLLVLGAAGGIGLSGVELGKLMGAKVIAAVSSEEKAALAREHGADETIIYPRGPLSKDEQRAFTKAIREAAGGDIDVVYDPVGGSYAEPSLRAMAWEGRYLIIGFPAGIPSIPLNLPLLKGCQLIGVFWGAFVARNPAENHQNIAQLLDLCAKGKLNPKISEIFPLERGGEAIARLASREALGKVLVRISED